MKFPVNDYTLKTKILPTPAGEKEVTYRYYKNIAYVANPVNAEYESMNVSVPIRVGGIDVDSMNAPILFNVNVGGYMSSSVKGGPPGGGPPPAGMFSGGPPPGGPPPGVPPGSELIDPALAAGYVVVDPACRGWDNKAADGTYYGKAPAAIVDLKSAVRYIRYNAGVFPGNAGWIITSGGSAGGALSNLLGASGNSDLYDKYLKEIGAADAEDNIYASISFSAITDLNHADMAYEWEFGMTPVNGHLVDQTISQELRKAFAGYQSSLNLQGENGFGTISAENYAEYLMQRFLIPSSNNYLRGLATGEREAYLSTHKWITWENNVATFTFADYVAHVSRLKGLPAFDSFQLGSTPETCLFGNAATDARHFTNFSLQHATGNPSAKIDGDMETLVNLMNPMYFIEHNNTGCCNYWWIRNGTVDNNASHVIAINLATLLQNKGENVNVLMYWDGGHAVDEDPEACIAWIGKITGYNK